MKITYLSHAGFLVETSKHRIVIDPFLTGNETAVHKPEDLACDYVVVTHGHGDHIGDSVTIAKNNNAPIVATFELALYLESQGAETVAMGIGGAKTFPFGRIKWTIAHHSSGIQTPDGFLYGGNPAGIILNADGKTLYHAGDTALFLDMKLIGELDPIDLALLPIGDNFTMGIDDAVMAIDFLKAKHAIPMHYGTFPPIEVDPNEFIAKASAAGKETTLLGIGETFTIG
ncbi:metal-dependent hydrolase [Planctomycetes bacterium Pan216]|uniref:UPF0173 metal-dependent hydrolase Pan216_54720 n=1 Tax=Kolteria novifilia TaxID=2527975 RepID=A0A518BC74_9BACT|nr:metal-dependent hydrolase [Planctomycetes bacterium Pan216]